jgi:hypothetical protein
MSKKREKIVQAKMIHIHAVCDQFEFWELIPEKKGWCRTKSIRAFYEFLVKRNKLFPKTYPKPSHLKVKMTVVNPEIF